MVKLGQTTFQDKIEYDKNITTFNLFQIKEPENYYS